MPRIMEIYTRNINQAGHQRTSETPMLYPGLSAAARPCERASTGTAERGG